MNKKELGSNIYDSTVTVYTDTIVAIIVKAEFERLYSKTWAERSVKGCRELASVRWDSKNRFT